MDMDIYDYNNRYHGVLFGWD